MTRRQLINFSILILLALALPIGYYLSQNTAIFRSRADAVKPIEFSGPNIQTREGKQVLIPDRTLPNGSPHYQVDLILTAPVPPLPTDPPTAPWFCCVAT